MGTVYKGWNARLYIDDIEIACAESASVDISASLDAYYCIGKRDAYAVVPGNFEITGSITHAWVNIYYLNLLGLADITAMPPKFKIVFKASTEVDSPMVYLYDCMFEKGSLDIPTDGVLKESYDFRATSIWVGVVT